MNKTQRKRLEKLIGFLKVLDRKKFDFGNVVRIWDDKHKCGTVCCAMGWTPAIFPGLVKWKKYSERLILIKNGDTLKYYHAADCLFGIPIDVGRELFRPMGQDEVHEELPVLKKPTPKQVTKMLKKFLRLVDKKEITL